MPYIIFDRRNRVAVLQSTDTVFSQGYCIADIFFDFCYQYDSNVMLFILHIWKFFNPVLYFVLQFLIFSQVSHWMIFSWL